jgi:predicted nucleic-acid-binding Zn-ribbon protein
MSFFLPKCPKCGSTNLKETKPKISLFKKVVKFEEYNAFPLLSLRKNKDNELPVLTCKNCGFSWPKKN